MNASVEKSLEFDAIRHLLVARAGSADARARLAALGSQGDSGAVRAALDETSEGVRVLVALGRQPYHDLPDVRESLAAARIEGMHLEPLALADMGSCIEGGLDICRRVARLPFAGRLKHLAAEVADTADIAVAIRRAILPGGEIADDASPQLRTLRRELLRLRQRLDSLMESFLHGKGSERLLQDRIVTTRNDRFVLLIKAEQRGQLPGIVHGTSGSGASVFVEPLPAVEVNNDIVAAADAERREVVRILQELTARVHARAHDVAHMLEVLGHLDAVQARALLARDMDAVAPEIVDGLDLELLDARHPLLLPALREPAGVEPAMAPPEPAETARREPVPVTLRVGFGAPVLVISGPNTGGKTVALKTVGLLALMAQCGLHIPAARGSRLPFFRRIFADIGDEQSIAASLSTFSAHLAAIVEMTNDLAAPALVLLDEVGAGTDPAEGGALAVAIVEHLRRQGAMTVATTHHGLLKAYAQSTAGVACASFGYDPTSYAPTYRLALGVPGRSLALEMAERLGLPRALVADARTRLSATEAQAAVMLQRLDEERARLEREKEAITRDRAVLTETLERQRAAEQALRAGKNAALESFARDLRKRSEEAARAAADAVRTASQRVESLREVSRKSVAAEAAKARSEAIEQIRAAQDAALADLQPESPREDELPATALVVGARVRVKSLGLAGELLALLDRGEAEVALSGKRLRVPRSELLVVSSSRGKPASVPVVMARPQAPHAGSSVEINVIGLSVDEALPRVDKFLDEAALAEQREIRVVHGFGQGTLRRAVAELLDGHPHVASFKPGGPREGGGGATIVELRD